MALMAVVLLPLLAALLCWAPATRKAAWQVTVAALAFEFALAVALAAQVIAHGQVAAAGGWLAADGLGALVILAVSFVCAVAAVFAGGYMRRQREDLARLPGFYANFNLLVFALVAVPALADPNLVWVAVELVTLFSVLLVGYDNTAAALEAAWKFSVLTIMGAPIALLGFLALFWAFHMGAPHGPETWAALRLAAPSMPPDVLRFAFLLVFVGFGAKAGLAPMHTWLPDAHSQAPSPVCAVLSGVKTSVPLYVILRLLGIVLNAPQARMGPWMLAIGLISVGVAAFLLLQVRDYKRMFAYSTVEHMGIVLTAAGLATRRSDFASVLQLFDHSITKSLCFLVAGVVLLELETREIGSVRGLLKLSPFAAAALVFCSLAIAGAPPFPIFLSEFSVLAAGFRAGHVAVAGVLAALIVVAFVGILMHVNRMVFGRPDRAARASVQPLPLSCRIAVLAAALPVLVLGVVIPAPLHHLLQLAAQQLGGR
jgi:hydrogenase-4 component F